MGPVQFPNSNVAKTYNDLNTMVDGGGTTPESIVDYAIANNFSPEQLTQAYGQEGWSIDDTLEILRRDFPTKSANYLAQYGYGNGYGNEYGYGDALRNEGGTEGYYYG